MSTTANAIYVIANGHRVALDLGEDTELLLSYQANDRLSPDTIQSDYSVEIAIPGNAHNHRLLAHAAASQPAKGAAYTRLPCLVTSGGVETLPLGILYIKGYSEGQYNLQIFAGNKRLVEAIGDKKLSDLDLSRFDHDWTPANILERLPYAYWQANGYGYELYDRGKPLDLANVDPYSLYPSCRAELVLQQIFADAGFTATSLLDEPFFAQLNVPSANPFAFSADYRDARLLKSGFEHTGNWFRGEEFAPEPVPNNFTSRKPYALGAVALASGTTANRYVVPTLGYYDLSYSSRVYFGCNESLPGEVSMKFFVQVNGAPIFNDDGSQVKAEQRVGKYTDTTLSIEKKRVLLHTGDVVEVLVQGDEYKSYGISPDQPQWYIGTRNFGILTPAPTTGVEPAVSFTVELTEEFPPGGRVHLNEWLPEMKQIDYLKAHMALGSLTLQVDPYTPTLHISIGYQLLANSSKARNWSAKLDRYSMLGRLPERNLEFRLGDYGQVNYLRYEEDENVLTDYGAGTLRIADEVLPADHELVKLPFAATQNSPSVGGLLQLLNFDTDDATSTPVVYSKVQAKPRIVLRATSPDLTGRLVLVPEHKDSSGNVVAAVLADFTTTASYFDGADLSLLLDKTVLTHLWQDTRAMLDESRYLTENLRLTSQDIAELDFSIPVWIGDFNDYFAVAQISEFDARRPTACKLVRLNAAHLGPPKVPGAGLREFYSGEWFNGEWF